MRTLKISKHRLSRGINVKSKSLTRGRFAKRRKCSCFVVTRSTVEFPKIWSELRESEQLCDGIVKCADGNAIFRVHRAIVSAVSPYFRALFTNSLNRGNPEVSEVSVDNVPYEALKLILDYAYTGTCAITQDNVEKLLPVADLFEVLGVIQLCCEFLQKEFQSENCLGILTFAHCYSCQELENAGWEFLLANFMDVVQKSDELVGINKALLQNILTDDRLNVRQEEMAFWALKLWVEENNESRCQQLPQLLQSIRFGLMKKSFFDGVVMKWGLLDENQECKIILSEAAILLRKIDALQVNLPMISRTSLVMDFNHHLGRPRIPYEILFAVGGWNSASPTSFIETYDIRSDRWFPSCSVDSTPRAYHGVVALNEGIYIIGGYDGSHYLNTVHQYNPILKTWSDRACMFSSRCYVSTCVLDGQIYALGGYDGQSRLKAGERYTPSTNQWEMIAPMHLQRSDAGASELNGKVYIVGGFDGTSVLSTAEVYDPKTNQWTFMRSMRSARSGVSVATYHNYLYALGGFDGANRLSSVERICPRGNNRWQMVPDMINQKSNFAATVLDDLLFVVGGYNGTTTVPLVEYYNDETYEWKNSSPMNLHRSALSICVMTGLPNAREYSYLSKLKVLGEGQSANGDHYHQPGLGEGSS